MGLLVDSIVVFIALVLLARYRAPAAVALSLVFIYGWLVLVNEDYEQRRQERISDAQRARSTVAAVPGEWSVLSERDPATGLDVARHAVIKSDDGLCELQVQELRDWPRRTVIFCSDLDISTAGGIQVKFDNRASSDRVFITRFGEPPYRYFFSPSQPWGSRSDYDEFLRQLSTANEVSLEISFGSAGRRWISFSLTGSTEALSEIGAI